MTTVDISAGGRQVVIEASPDLPLSKVVKAALDTWRATEGAEPRPRTEAGGLGFQVERADEPL